MTTLPQTTPMRLPRPGNNQLVIPSSNGHTHVAVPHAPGNNSLTGADALRVLRTNLWLIILALIVSGVAGYFLNMWLLSHYSRFTSTALVRVSVESELPRIGEEARTLVYEPSPQSIEVEQQTQAASMTNKSFLGSILEDPQSEIRQTGWFKSFGSSIEDAKEELIKKLDVSPRQNTRLIEVVFGSPSASDSQKVVRSIVDRHIADRKQRIQNVQIQKSQDLQSLMTRYGEDQSRTRDRIAALARELAASGSSLEGASALDYEIEQALAQQIKAGADFEEAKAKLETFKKAAADGLDTKEMKEMLGQTADPLDSQIQALQSERAFAVNHFGEQSQRVKDIDAELEPLVKQRDETQGARRDKVVASILAEKQSDVAVAQKNLENVTKKLAELQQSKTAIAAKQYQLAQLKEEERTTREQLQKTEDERNKLQLFIQQNNWATAELAQPADLPEKPSFPKLWITLTLTCSLGLMLSVGIAFLRELMDTSVRSPRDIARVGQLNLLGMIPHESDDPETAGARLPLAIFEAPQSIIAEQFRQVRTRLQHSASLDTVRSLLVTGTSPGDGKTTVACNLAAGLALNGRRILLVDGNFRKPQLHGIFNLPNEVGFGDVLNSLDAFDEAVRETDVPNLSVLPSGAKPSNPTELLESQLLIDFIERALEEYDHVIFDSGPLLIVSETAALAPRVDGVVTVCRAQSNSRGMLQRLRDQLRQLKAEHLGVILNAVRSQTGGYYAPMIKTYYAYQNR